MTAPPAPADKDGAAATLYARLLTSALEAVDGGRGSPERAAALADVLRCRLRFAGGTGIGEGESATDAVSTQLAYDVALIRFARCLGVSCGPSDFDRPAAGRERLEREITARDVHLE